MCWHDLLFLHWPVPAEQLRGLVPPDLAIDRFDGTAWLGVIPFRMSGVRLRGLPAFPGAARFPELNVRTYVTHQDKPGVWFFSLDAASRMAVRAARLWFGLPYYLARMRVAGEPGWVEYQSLRRDRHGPPAEFHARYRPAGEPRRTSAGSLEYFLTERYCLYALDRRGRLGRGEIDHIPWPLQPAEAELRVNRMVEPLGLATPAIEPVCHFARDLEVVAWALRVRA
jgi:uncharacterized protein YqjF (DUF2071 family)